MEGGGTKTRVIDDVGSLCILRPDIISAGLRGTMLGSFGFGDAGEGCRSGEMRMTVIFIIFFKSRSSSLTFSDQLFFTPFFLLDPHSTWWSRGWTPHKLPVRCQFETGSAALSVSRHFCLVSDGSGQ